MRPVKLEMEGFLAYRQHTEVDFTGSDLFVLAGPTGSGKSSVIDAITFALYGSVPRLDDKRLIEPVINATLDRARVMFEFSIGGEVWQVARSLQRTKTGAKMTAASLQSGQLVYADSEVTSKVEELLGLTFDQFTKAVVLPQGDFAEFITDTPREKQDLLRALLDLGLFEEIKKSANARASSAAGRAAALEEGLSKLDVPDDAEMDLARKTVRVLAQAVDELPARLDRVATAAAGLADLATSIAELTTRVERLSSIAVPAALAATGEQLNAAEQELEKARIAVSEHERIISETRQKLGQWADLADLRRWVETLSQIDSQMEARAAIDLEGLERAARVAGTVAAGARQALDRAMESHAAHVIRVNLEPGDPCPVCGQTVDILPDMPDPGEYEIETATVAWKAADEAATLAANALAGAKGRVETIERQLAHLRETVSEAPTTAREDLPRVIEVKESLDALLADTGSREKAVEGAAAALEQARIAASGIGDALMAARDLVASEHPPVPKGDIVASWNRMIVWRDDTVTALQEENESLRSRHAALSEDLAGLQHDLGEWLGALGMKSTGNPETELALALAKATADLEGMERTVVEAAELKVNLHEAEKSAAVAGALGNHLKSSNFEAWVMEEAMDVLIVGANDLLLGLADGAYSLLASGGQFEVIDHRNADQVRPVRSLSGGELFLVSLSLALSMASQLAELTSTSTRLESVFLDEGFGSLDQESLDTVASVLDELVGRGRTVGLVTHVKELSDRIPVRFEVTKEPTGSVIRKVLA